MDGKRKGFLVALVIGLVSAPALALVASGLLGGQAVADEPVTTTAAATAPATIPPATTTTAPPADLERACTVEGWALAAGEAAGRLSDLQQAALDALRPICEAEGLPLKAAPAAQAAAPTAPVDAAAAPAAQYGDADQGEYDDDGGSRSQYEDHGDEGEGDDEGGD